MSVVFDPGLLCVSVLSIVYLVQGVIGMARTEAQRERRIYSVFAVPI